MKIDTELAKKNETQKKILLFYCNWSIVGYSFIWNHIYNNLHASFTKNTYRYTCQSAYSHFDCMDC